MTTAQTTQTKEVIYRFDIPYPSQLKGIELRVGDTLLITGSSKVLTMGALGTMGAFPNSEKILGFYAKFLDLCESRAITITLKEWPLFPKGTRIIKITKFDETGLFVKVVS